MSEHRLTGQGEPDTGVASRNVRNYESVVGPAIDDLRAAVGLIRREPVDLPYEGYNIGRKERATCLDPKFAFTAENLIYSDEDQGRDAAEEIMGTAARLGIEQGRRQAWQRVLGECEKDEVDLLATLDLSSLYADYFAGEEGEPYGWMEDDEQKAELLERYADDIARAATYKPWPPIREEIPVSELIEPIRTALNGAYELDNISEEESLAVDRAIERVVLAGAEQGRAMCYKEIDETIGSCVRHAKIELEIMDQHKGDAMSAEQLADVEKIEAILSRV